MKKINVFCVLVLALMLIDFVVDLFLNTSDANVELKLENESLGFVLFTFFFVLLALGAVVVAVVSFVKFVLNVNRNEVFTVKNIKLIRKSDSQVWLLCPARWRILDVPVFLLCRPRFLGCCGRWSRRAG